MAPTATPSLTTANQTRIPAGPCLRNCVKVPLCVASRVELGGELHDVVVHLQMVGLADQLCGPLSELIDSDRTIAVRIL